MFRVLFAVLAATLVAGGGNAATYYVSPTGNDGANGQSVGAAWLTIDRGDRMGVLAPGDTVLILPGTYFPTTTPALSTSGTALDPVVYICMSDSAAVLDGGNQSFEAIRIEGDYVTVSGLEITNYNSTAVLVTGDNVGITRGYFHDVSLHGISTSGSSGTFTRNLIVGCGGHGVSIGASGLNNRVYNNTIHSNTLNGVDISPPVVSTRVINNIAVQNDYGVSGISANRAAFNLTWNNVKGGYTNGITDSAGGIIADPMFVNAGAGDFTLQAGSPAIDTAMDLGDEYNGSAPDMGAFESPEINFAPELVAIDDTTISENQTLVLDVTASDPDGDSLILNTENLPTNASFTDHADGTGELTFTPDFDQAGDYTIRIIAADSALADTVEFDITVDNTNRAPVLDPIGPQAVEEGQTLNLTVTASDPDGETPDCSALSAPAGASFSDNGDGTADFDFVPGYAQEGIYSVTFVATDGSLSDSELVEITVTPAPISYLVVSPDSATVEVFDTVQFSAVGYDAGDVQVADVTDSVVWTTTDPSGMVDDTGLYVAGGDVSPPDYFVVATYDGTLSDSGMSRVISDGAVNRLQIEWADGTPVGDTSVTTDDDGLVVYCRGYDIGNTLLGDIAVEWCWVGGGAIGSFAPSHGTSTTLTLTAPGVDRLAIDCGSAMTDTSGVFTVTTGAPAMLAVNPNTATLSVDSTLDFDAATFDADGNVSDVQIVPSWTVLGGIGQIDVVGLLTPTTVGDGYVVASSGGEGVPICPPNLVHYWWFDDAVGPPYVDAAGADDATCTDCPKKIAGRVGSGLDFNGVVPGEHLTAASSDGITSNFTVAAWVRLDGVILLKDNGVIGRDGAFALEVKALTNDLTLTLTNGADTQVVVPGLSANKVQSLTWVQVVATFDGSWVRLYIDGTQVIGTGANFSSVGTGVGQYTIGYTIDDHYLDGRIDEVAMFDRALTALEIQQLRDDGIAHEPICETVVLGIADTSDVVQVTAGALASIELSPDSIVVSSDSTIQFVVAGYDSYGNPRDPGSINYDLTGPVGTIDAGGLFEADVVGTANVIAQSDLGPIDTTTWLEVVAGSLDRLVISPRDSAVRVGDTIQFTVTGYDADSNVVAPGSINWRALGRVGTIDSTGLFVATAAGKGKVAAVSSLTGTADTTDFVDVDEVLVSAIPIGVSYVRPGEDRASLLSLSVRNYFDSGKTITGLTVRDATRGPGTSIQRLTDIDSVAVYLDTDRDSLLSAADSLLGWAVHSAATTTPGFNPLTVPPDSEVVLLLGGAVNLFARDSDSLDLFCQPAVDLVIQDGTIPVAADSVNSLGVAIVDGLIADQIRLYPTGVMSVEPADSMYEVMRVDLPRNGYQDDTLYMFSIASLGTAGADDFDSLALFREVSNTSWDGAGSEEYIGRMYFTGDRWTITGIHVPLDDPNTRFYVGASVAAFPTNGATLIPYVPVNGVQVWTGNDGPVDAGTGSVDTLAIIAFEALSIVDIPLGGGTLTPGVQSDALLAARITNTFSSAVAIDSLALDLVATSIGAPTQEQIDSQIDSVYLYVSTDSDNSDLMDSLIAVGRVSAGVALFETAGLQVSGNGGMVTLVVSAAVSLRDARNGNTLGFRITDDSRIWTTPSVAVAGSFPIANTKPYTVNAFPLAAVVVHALQGQSLFGGQEDRLVMDFELPRNGYSVDSLYEIHVVNRGSFEDDNGLTNMKLWADDGSGTFSDALVEVGEFQWNGATWRLRPGPFYPLTDTTTRFYLTVSIGTDNREGGTLDLEIPIAAVSCISGMNGADDAPIKNPETHVVFQSNRVTAIALPQPSVDVAPAQADVNLLTLALYNGYVGQAQTVRSIALSNRTMTQSSPAFADAELGQVRFYFDSDRNRVFSDDSLVATGSFAGGRLNLSGIDVTLPPESLTYFFAVVDVAENAIDADSLAVSVDRTADITFAAPVILNGDFPLVSGGYRTVDGSVWAQYHSLSLEARSLRPGDTLVPVFAITPAVNGDQSDVLESIRVTNMQSAADSDFDRLTVWLDTNADSVWQGSDSLLGVMTGSGGVWDLAGLNLSVDTDPPVLFVLCDVALSATPGAGLQLAVPENGCQYVSDNDGPLDEAVEADNKFVVSTSGLRITNVPVSPSYSVGQTITITTTVTNVLATPMDSVFGVSIPTGPVALDSASSGPVALASGEETTFTFYYSATATGTASWELSAYESVIPDSSAVVRTAEVALQSPAALVPIHFINSVPTAVTKGQTNVFPLSLGIAHPDESDTTASIKLSSLTVSVVDGTGASQLASDAFTRMALSSGYTTLAAYDIVPQQSSITFTFSQPIVVDPGESRLLSLLVDIGDSATARDFALRITSASAIPIVDFNTGQSVSLSGSLTFPLSTASCRIDDPSEQLAVSYRSVAPATMNFGQPNVPLMRVILRHPGDSTSSQVQLSALSLAFIDNAYATVNAHDVCTRIRVIRGQTVVAEVSGSALDTNRVTLNLVSPVTISPGEIDSVRLTIDAASSSGIASTAVQIADSTELVVRDLSSGLPLTAISDDQPLASASTGFPMLSALTAFRSPAVAPEVCLGSSAGGAVIAGRDTLNLVDIILKYPVSGAYSSQRLSRVATIITDSLGSAVDAGLLFDRIGVSRAPGQVDYLPIIQQSGIYTIFGLPDSGLVINPGDSVSVRLVADVESDAPVSHFVVHIDDISDFELYDVSDSLNQTGIVIEAGCGGSLPFETSPIRILQPAGRPQWASLMSPARLVPQGQQQTPLYEGTIAYASATPQGDIDLSSVTAQFLSRDVSGYHSEAASTVFSAVHLVIDEQIIATDSVLADDTLRLVVEDYYTISVGDDLAFSLTGDVRADAPLGNYVVAFIDSASVDLTDHDLATSIYPQLGQSVYPIYGTEISLTVGGVGESFTNYPNPFRAGAGEQTRIAFVLPAAAYIDISLFTITGERVIDLVSHEYRVAGVYQEDLWDGRNGAGLDVVPGTYFCRLTVRYDDGRVEEFRRKVAVLR
ncbi:right-handed parallel beta-helix repeat-containing protein [bacterium]|nr:right-handed parallel beta-helix repeat-containing protein [bacterium]